MNRYHLHLEPYSTAISQIFEALCPRIRSQFFLLELAAGRLWKAYKAREVLAVGVFRSLPHLDVRLFSKNGVPRGHQRRHSEADMKSLQDSSTRSYEITIGAFRMAFSEGGQDRSSFKTAKVTRTLEQDAITRTSSPCLSIMVSMPSWLLMNERSTSGFLTFWK